MSKTEQIEINDQIIAIIIYNELHTQEIKYTQETLFIKRGRVKNDSSETGSVLR